MNYDGGKLRVRSGVAHEAGEDARAARQSEALRPSVNASARKTSESRSSAARGRIARGRPRRERARSPAIRRARAIDLRIDELERRLAAVESKSEPDVPAWLKNAGWAENDPIDDAAMKLGA